jgi:histidinol dehydrogenase
MKIITTKRALSLFLKKLKRRSIGINLEVENTVRRILNDVKDKGDRALYEYTYKYDLIKPKNLRISNNEIIEYSKGIDKRTLSALKVAKKRIQAFHKRQKEESWSYLDGKSLLGQIIRPIERVGVYIPGGKASYPSTVLMNIIPAQIAGIKEIAVCVPCPHGFINSAVMASLNLLGVEEVYRIGGAQAIGAMAYGTETIKRVDKIVGPGNIYVATAKKLVFGEVDIDMVAGPSEILIVADEKAKPDFIAADLLSQAEHDEFASSILITDSLNLARAVKFELRKQVRSLIRREIAIKSLNNFGAIIVSKDLFDAFDLVNIISPEHLELMVEEPEKYLNLIKNAGAIFVGEWTPEALGDYAAGPNHTLPTCGTARYSSPLGVYDFIKKTSILRFTEDDFKRLAEVVKIISTVEGLEAHGNAVKIRERLFHCKE